MSFEASSNRSSSERALAASTSLFAASVIGEIVAGVFCYGRDCAVKVTLCLETITHALWGVDGSG
jgi:hypothetical protein